MMCGSLAIDRADRFSPEADPSAARPPPFAIFPPSSLYPLSFPLRQSSFPPSFRHFPLSSILPPPAVILSPIVRPPSYPSPTDCYPSARNPPSETFSRALARSRFKSSFLYIFIYIYVGTMIYCSYSDNKIGTIQGSAWLAMMLKCWNFCRVPKGTHIPCYFIPAILQA